MMLILLKLCIFLLQQLLHMMTINFNTNNASLNRITYITNIHFNVAVLRKHRFLKTDFKFCLFLMCYCNTYSLSVCIRYLHIIHPSSQCVSAVRIFLDEHQRAFSPNTSVCVGQSIPYTWWLERNSVTGKTEGSIFFVLVSIVRKRCSVREIERFIRFKRISLALVSCCGQVSGSKENNTLVVVDH